VSDRVREMLLPLQGFAPHVSAIHGRC
jgi:hypothetical protein